MTTDMPSGKILGELLSNLFRETTKDYNKTVSWLKEVSPGKKLLEFGSSWGYFLFQAQAQGFDSIGVDISEKRRKFGKKKLGVRIENSVDGLLEKRLEFDVIYTAHTLEHLGKEISGIFFKFSQLLKDKGLLVIIVPHFDLERGEEIFSIVGAIHPLGFVKSFFEKSLPRFGFKVMTYEGCTDFEGDCPWGPHDLTVIAQKNG